MSSPKVWFITGCSSGFGRELAQIAASHGDFVVGTLRKAEQIAAFEDLAPGALKGVLLDVSNPQQIEAGVQAALDWRGTIDVLVNNAGYGSIGPVEEIEDSEMLRQFDVNVFGAVRMIRAVLPTMRSHRKGFIINITSIAGLQGYPGVGIYNGSKFALEGIGEALAKEVIHLGIKVTNVEPGPFRTDWAGRSATFSTPKIDDYAASAHQNQQNIANVDGQQSGDPRKAAEAMYTLTTLENPPVHLPLGGPAYTRIRLKLQEMQDEIEAFAYLGEPTDFAS